MDSPSATEQTRHDTCFHTTSLERQMLSETGQTKGRSYRVVQTGDEKSRQAGPPAVVSCGLARGSGDPLRCDANVLELERVGDDPTL